MKHLLWRFAFILTLLVGVLPFGCAPPDTAPQITLHWTAGSHTWQPPEKPYHLLITGSGRVLQERSLAVPGAHVLHRNTRNIGVAFMAMAKGYPVTPIQVERMAAVAGELSFTKGIPLDRVRDHAYHARTTFPPYTNLRWDIGHYYPIVMAKIPWYRQRAATWRKQGKPLEFADDFY